MLLDIRWPFWLYLLCLTLSLLRIIWEWFNETAGLVKFFSFFQVVLSHMTQGFCNDHIGKSPLLVCSKCNDLQSCILLIKQSINKHLINLSNFDCLLYNYIVYYIVSYIKSIIFMRPSPHLTTQCCFDWYSNGYRWTQILYSLQELIILITSMPLSGGMTLGMLLPTCSHGPFQSAPTMQCSQTRKEKKKGPHMFESFWSE